MIRQKNPTTNVTCPKCGEVFKQKRSNQKFCTKKCKHYYYVRVRKKKLQQPYAKFKKSSCDFCGFKAIDTCQLDIDHIDGNHKNNSLENLQTLCANCHRLKTKLNKEGPYKWKKG